MDKVIYILIITNVISVFAFIIKETWNVFKGDTKENTTAVKDLTKSTNKLSNNITELQTQMRFVSKDVKMIHEVKKDVTCSQKEIINLRGVLRECQAKHIN